MIVSLERTSDENVGNVLRCSEMSEQFIIAHYVQDIPREREENWDENFVHES